MFYNLLYACVHWDLNILMTSPCFPGLPLCVCGPGYPVRYPDGTFDGDTVDCSFAFRSEQTWLFLNHACWMQFGESLWNDLVEHWLQVADESVKCVDITQLGETIVMYFNYSCLCRLPNRFSVSITNSSSVLLTLSPVCRLCMSWPWRRSAAANLLAT